MGYRLMGRASGGPQASASAIARRHTKPTPAELLGAEENPLYRSAPTNPAIYSYQGVMLYRADSNDVSLRVPTVRAGNDDVYPQVPREGKSKLDGEFWQRLVRAGNVYRVTALSEMMLNAGVGNNALGGKGKDAPIAEARLREELHAWAWEGLIPVGSDVPLPDGERGYGLLRDRAASREYAAQLRSRSSKQKQSLAALSKYAQFYFSAADDDRKRWLVPGMAFHEREALLRVLGDGLWHKNVVLARAIWGAKLQAEGLTGERLKRELAKKGSTVRERIAVLRTAGIPVLGSPAQGVRLASNKEELGGYLEDEARRMAATDDHARRIEQAGALWYPESPEEVERSARWQSRLRKASLSPQTVKRERQRRDNADHSKHNRDEVRKNAAQREAELMKTPLWAEQRYKNAAGLPLNKEEQILVADLKRTRKEKKTGIARKQEARQSAPTARTSRSPIPPPPWLTK